MVVVPLRRGRGRGDVLVLWGQGGGRTSGRRREEVSCRIYELHAVMSDSRQRGCCITGLCPGGAASGPVDVRECGAYADAVDEPKADFVQYGGPSEQVDARGVVYRARISGRRRCSSAGRQVRCELYEPFTVTELTSDSFTVQDVRGRN